MELTSINGDKIYHCFEEVTIVAFLLEPVGEETPAARTGSESSLARFFHHIAPLGLFSSLARLLHQLSAWGSSSIPVENIGSQDDRAPSPDRPVRHAKKRLGRLAHLLFTIIPARFQRALGYLPADCMGQSGIPEEIQKSPVRPSGKGSKRKQDDVALEEQQSWVEILQQELPEDDEAEDSTYEPTRSETDSEEYRSQNETETDLEFEEKDGVLVLKELQSLQLHSELPDCVPWTLQGTLTGENMPAAASGGGGDALEQPAAASGGGGDALEQPAAASGGGGDALEQPAAASGGDWVEVIG
ncbi:uncharacterized protein LOC128828764 isoform X1 [Malaclemys terrapin pileata]|uniref:uncharacterized protein LOC128828764 isoform X1 n=1 Tax=Malaclemys terrapin pileata TaxID=2991368 RepID=UPI0023A7F8C9|nr:uncharacterized protein LOC128828764 isoform X1 [Malaclemys terrapin pileata]XP_053869675.1 uncharacterized protein LOC128828764 isoform X1 [Malaclemys terrapin pileata]